MRVVWRCVQLGVAPPCISATCHAKSRRAIQTASGRRRPPGRPWLPAPHSDLEARRHESQLERGVQHLVIQRAVQADALDAGLGLRAPRGSFHGGGRLQQGGRIGGARPVGLQRLLGLAVGAWGWALGGWRGGGRSVEAIMDDMRMGRGSGGQRRRRRGGQLHMRLTLLPAPLRRVCRAGNLVVRQAAFARAAGHAAAGLPAWHIIGAVQRLARPLPWLTSAREANGGARDGGGTHCGVGELGEELGATSRDGGDHQVNTGAGAMVEIWMNHAAEARL